MEMGSISSQKAATYPIVVNHSAMDAIGRNPVQAGKAVANKEVLVKPLLQVRKLQIRVFAQPDLGCQFGGHGSEEPELVVRQWCNAHKTAMREIQMKGLRLKRGIHLHISEKSDLFVHVPLKAHAEIVPNDAFRAVCSDYPGCCNALLSPISTSHDSLHLIGDLGETQQLCSPFNRCPKVFESF
jgi:hypothetical protein